VANEPRIPRDIFIIDEAVRKEYYFIEPHDTCLYVWERMSHLWREGERLDYSQYPVNGLISNLQIPASCKASHAKRYYWKEKAIKYAAFALGKLIPDILRQEGVVFVAIPPSKIETDPDYDPRIIDTLRAVRPRLPDIRPLVVLSGEGFDSKQKGLKPADRAQYYAVDEDLADPEPQTIVLFDDVLTTGCHFKAMELVLKERFPEVETLGLFLARTVRPPEEDDEDPLAWLLA
jgi:hypothetical protein